MQPEPLPLSMVKKYKKTNQAEGANNSRKKPTWSDNNILKQGTTNNSFLRGAGVR